MTRPSLLATARELATPRAAAPLRWTSVRHCPDGDHGPVLVLPGLLGTDRGTRQFRDCLQMLGYTPLPWGLGLNLGPTPRRLEELALRVSFLARDHGPLHVVGFGMGGLFARWAAQSRGTAIARLVTVNAPFREPLELAWRNVRAFTLPQRGLDLRSLAFMLRQVPEQPWHAIYSRKDGVVSWNACHDPRFPERCFDIPSRHMSCMRDARVFRQVAQCLAEKEAVLF
jgi:pimeloyl-ACP methyl ester carboxylesterase